MLSESDIKQSSPLVLAYMGDAVYEKYIREYVIRQGLCKNGLLHKKSIHYVSAKAQAMYLEKLININFFSEKELSIIKRARNHKSHSSK